MTSETFSMGATKSEQDFYSDSPVTEPSDDRFRRWPFSQRIAQTVAGRKDSSSLVIGIYGPWGDGKTTVLNFIERELRDQQNVVVIRFNPWRFNNEAQLLLGFFNLLADHLERSLKTTTEKVGELLQKYGKLVTPLSLTLQGGVGIAGGSSISDLGDSIASVDLEELKNRIEAVLIEEKKRIIVMMDDIDRLDNQEVYSVFRLVKLTGDFQYTTYILAFDEQIVAASLAERYGTGDIHSGRAFLEKIVQVPLNLPRAEKICLREVCFQGVDFALQASGIVLSDEQSHDFVRHFVTGLEFRLTTPRLAKRYANALCFAFPILKDEVDPTDLALIEGIRVFLPKLYEVIKTNRTIFLAEGMDRRWSEKQKPAMLEVIERGFEGLSEAEKDSAKNLIKALFPRTESLFGNMSYGSDWNKVWSCGKKATSTEYFDRYFSYAIPSDDVSDISVRALIERLPILEEGVLSKELVELMGTRGADRLLTKLFDFANDMPATSAVRLAKAISKLGDKFPNPETMFSAISGLWVRVGCLIGKLLERSDNPKARTEIAVSIMQDGEPIEFACEMFRWLRRDADKDNAAFFGKQGLKKIGKAIADRIKKYAADKPIYVTSPKQTSSLLGVWRRWSSRTEVTTYLLSCFNKEPSEVTAFLSCYRPTAWGMDTGKKSKGDFERTSYDNVAWTVEASKIYSVLLKIYGKELRDPKYHLDDCRDEKRQLAHQFAYIHLQVKSERNLKSQQVVIRPST